MLFGRLTEMFIHRNLPMTKGAPDGDALRVQRELRENYLTVTLAPAASS